MCASRSFHRSPSGWWSTNLRDKFYTGGRSKYKVSLYVCAFIASAKEGGYVKDDVYFLSVNSKRLGVDFIRTEKFLHFSNKISSGFVLSCKKLKIREVPSSPVHLFCNILLYVPYLHLGLISITKLHIIMYLVWYVQTVVLPHHFGQLLLFQQERLLCDFSVWTMRTPIFWAITLQFSE